MSQIFKHGLSLYDELARIAEESEDEHFHGSMVEAFKSTGASQALYSRLFRTLEKKGCIETLVAARGGGGRVSEIVLIRPPIEEDFKLPPSSLTKLKTDDIIGQRMSNMERRLPDIDLTELLQNFEKRISTLEEKFREVQRFASSPQETEPNFW